MNESHELRVAHAPPERELRMGRVVLLLFLWSIQMTVALVVVQASWIEHVMGVERGWVAAQFGESHAQRLEQEASDRFQRWCVSSGWVGESYIRLLPDPNQPQRGMEGLAPGFFVWMRRRIDACWWIVYEAIFRAVLLQTWELYLMAPIVACAVDGLVLRAIKQREHGYSSSDRYAIARRVILLLLAAVLVYLFLPLPISPLAIPIWAGVCALTVGVLAANAQQKT